MKIAIDAHGGDSGLKPNIEGALLADRQLPHDIYLVGRDPEIREELRKRKASPSAKVRIVHARDIVEMAAQPIDECRTKPDSSLMVAVDMLAQGKVDAVVSAGNSGAVMVAALLKVKRIPGIIRPAIAIPFPTPKGVSLLLDAGANMEVKPWHLVQFAVMGSAYMRTVFNNENPSVSLLSIGEEETKGNELVIEAIPLMKASGLNFAGPIEGRDVPEGKTDVVVTDGFTGNVVLKLSEGLAKTIFKMLKTEIKRKFTYKIGALLMKKIFRDLKTKMSSDELGGAPLLGVNAPIFICHGKANSREIFSAVRTAADFARSNILGNISDSVNFLKNKIKDSGNGVK